GQAGGAGIVDLLTGASSPSGRLAETVPVHLEDVPSFGAFPGELGTVRYGEGVFVGYRHYDLRHAAVAYPFGFGLSYTTFEIDGVEASVRGSGADATVTVAARVTNTGAREGAEVVQVYIGDPASLVARPVRELKGFARVSLEPGESRTVRLELDSRALAYWHPTLHRWAVEGGAFNVEVGTSSRDIVATVVIDVAGDDLSTPLHEMSTVREMRANPATAAAAEGILSQFDAGMLAMVDDFPLAVVAGFGVAGFDREALRLAIESAATARAGA
ncbi:MAG: beta-glucosidase, partial [Demequinaceae bacterium]|nr:beta-glucosidase [Demequinaceae bacterium]